MHTRIADATTILCAGAFLSLAPETRLCIMRGMDITETRKAMGLSQAELALALGVTQSTVSRLETGELEPNERTKLALEALLSRHERPA